MAPKFSVGASNRLALEQREAAEVFGDRMSAFSHCENGKAKALLALMKLLKELHRYPALLDRVRGMQRLQPSMKNLLLSLSLLLSSLAFSNTPEPRYALTEMTTIGSKGKIVLTQVAFVSPPRAKTKCNDSLDATRSAKGIAVISVQSCLNELPLELQRAEQGMPLQDAYVIFWQNTVFFFFKVQGMAIVKYSFDPGNPSDICKRWVEKFNALEPGSRCIPPMEIPSTAR